MRKIFRLLSKVFIICQAFLAIGAIVVTEVLEMNDFRDEMVIGLLTIIVFDFFIFAVEYLESISKNTEDIFRLLDKKGVRVDFVERSDFNLTDVICSAQHDIFISGTTLTHLVGKKDVFLNIRQTIKVNFLVLDLLNQDAVNAFRRMRYKDNIIHTNQRYINQGNLFKDLFNALRGCTNITFAVSDRIMPITFVAIDINKITSSTMIKVQHYLYEKEADQATVSYIVKPGNPMFDLFKEEIQILWDNAIKEENKLYFSQ